MRPARDLPGGAALHPALAAIVEDAFRVGVGGTLPTNAHYLTVHGIAAGTMQRALAVLAERGALLTRSHGQLGRMIVSLDPGEAWRLASRPPLRVVLPRLGPPEAYALEQELADELARLDLPFATSHVPGAARRMDLVDTGAAEVALVSSGALRSAGRSTAAALVLEPGTYYAAHRIVSVRRASDAGRTPRHVAVDAGSPDHLALSLEAFPPGDGYVHVQTPFHRVPVAVARGDVDAGLWHRTATPIPLDLAGLVGTPLRMLESRDAWEQLSRATLYAREGTGAAPVLALLDFTRLIDRQAEELTLADESLGSG